MEGNSGRTARKTISSRRIKLRHPYQDLQGTALWKAINEAIIALVKNGDIKETTRREYIVGYLCKMVGQLGHP